VEERERAAATRTDTGGGRRGGGVTLVTRRRDSTEMFPKLCLETHCSPPSSPSKAIRASPSESILTTLPTASSGTLLNATITFTHLPLTATTGQIVSQKKIMRNAGVRTSVKRDLV
jgi:hypothetical protein